MTRNKRLKTDWEILRELICEYADACRADEMKGGGDPEAVPEIEACMNYCLARLDVHISRMERLARE